MNRKKITLNFNKLIGQVNMPTAVSGNRAMQNFLLKAKDKASVTTVAGKSTAVSRIIDMSVPILE